MRMFKKYFGIVEEQSRDVFGTHPKKTLSAFSFFSVAAVILPLAILILFILLKFF
jgi:hypothetical protein